MKTTDFLLNSTGMILDFLARLIAKILAKNPRSWQQLKKKSKILARKPGRQARGHGDGGGGESTENLFGNQVRGTERAKIPRRSNSLPLRLKGWEEYSRKEQYLNFFILLLQKLHKLLKLQKNFCYVIKFHVI